MNPNLGMTHTEPISLLNMAVIFTPDSAHLQPSLGHCSRQWDIPLPNSCFCFEALPAPRPKATNTRVIHKHWAPPAFSACLAVSGAPHTVSY